jgi:hypothetical protein
LLVGVHEPIVESHAERITHLEVRGKFRAGTCRLTATGSAAHGKR